MNLKERICDWYLTWRTGKNRSQRDWEAWYETHVIYRASTIENMFMHFEHIIEVDPQRFMDPHEPFAWVPNKDARQYFWPQRSLEDTAVWRIERVSKDQWDGRWHINELGGEDRVFVATNSEADATWIALKFMS